MKTKNVTITSKNQITLPAEYVRKLQLARSRVLRVDLQGRTIVLTPQPRLGNAMQRFWGRHQAERPLTDEELKQAACTSSVSRFAENA